MYLLLFVCINYVSAISYIATYVGKIIIPKITIM